MAWLLSCSTGLRDNDRLDAVVELGGKDVIPLGDVLERNPMRHNLTRLEIAVLNVREQPRPLPLDRTLVGVNSQALIHGVTELDGAKQRPIGPHHRNRSTLANRIDSPIQRNRGSPLQLQ